MSTTTDSEKAPPCQSKEQEKIEEEQKVLEQQEGGDIVTTQEVKASSERGIDYDKLLTKFGCHALTQDHVDRQLKFHAHNKLYRIQKLTGLKPHPLIRRGYFFSHRDFDEILNLYEQGKAFYLYTGRGPSSDSLHMGHMIPFIITKWLQDAFGVPLVIQVTDDEKYLYRQELTLKQTMKYAMSNIKDIIAFGFDINKTFIFTDTDYIHYLYPNVLATQKHVTFNQIKGIFGVNQSSNCGKIAFPAVQAVPAFSSSFPHIFGSRKNVPCLIPQAIDQDPYFRMTRDVAEKLGFRKPSCLHSKFFPALQGPKSKMNASVQDSAIFVTDTKKQIESKIKKKAFSGGKDTKEEQEKYGADIEIDVSIQYLRFFWENDEELKEMQEAYKTGKILTGHVKAKCAQVMWEVMSQYQKKRKQVTDDLAKQFMKVRKIQPFADLKNKGFKKQQQSKKVEQSKKD